MKSLNIRRIADRSSGATTFIAEGCVVEGDLRGSGDFMICGEVRGNSYLTGTVTIVQTGKWVGSLTARNVVVAGTVEGDIVANGQIEVCQSARINGTVTGVAIAVGQGAVIDGALRTIQHDELVEFEERRNAEEEAATG